MAKNEHPIYDDDWDRLITVGWPTLPEGAEAEVQEAARQTARMLEAAPRDVVLAKLAELWALTKQRGTDADDMKLMLGAFGSRLMEYPEDVVREACDRWGRREKWWPSWAELKAECDQLVKWRRAAYRQLSGKAVLVKPADVAV